MNDSHCNSSSTKAEVTTANRILRLYVRTEESSSELIQLTHYIMRVQYRNKTLVGVIKNSRYLSEDLKKLVDSVIYHNTFTAHPENLLLSMLAEERRHFRKLAVRRIIKARGSSSVERRRFVVPKINFKANQHIEMIDWFKCDFTQPPITANFTVEQLKYIAENGSIKDLLNLQISTSYTIAGALCKTCD
ncbi:hypothetical protein AVEN_14879-1 [Araneus ventricosus]|uniref:Uncharacterized protein n=1 Tax=Araneus ventricosus TaxID=182803 RepID=A0A4Y2F969_ARAVE|nr:hypothetical protein AVEN_14879-1 [Araneus ventricosus]